MNKIILTQGIPLPIFTIPTEKVSINPYFDGRLEWPEMKIFYIDFKR